MLGIGTRVSRPFCFPFPFPFPYPLYFGLFPDHDGDDLPPNFQSAGLNTSPYATELLFTPLQLVTGLLLPGHAGKAHVLIAGLLAE